MALRQVFGVVGSKFQLVSLKGVEYLLVGFSTSILLVSQELCIYRNRLRLNLLSIYLAPSEIQPWPLWNVLGRLVPPFQVRQVAKLFFIRVAYS